MADVSILAQNLCRILEAMGWATEASRFTVRATEPAFEPVERTWMVGKASAITEEEVRLVSPSRIIVEDFATEAQIERLSSLLGAGPEGGQRVATYTTFVDDLWGAPAALRRAIDDAESDDPDALFGEPEGFTARHLTQLVSFETHSIPDHRALDHGIPLPSMWLAILADAGLGKSEFLRLHEYRAAQLYQSARRASVRATLPPISVRVSLRDFRSLSLDYIAHALSQPVQRSSRVPLPRISSGAVLRELLTQGRLILLLDGLDEVIADASTIEAGMNEWHRVVSAGGRLVVASRTGHASSNRVISRRFREDETARMQPLDRPQALELLERRGASPERASQILAALAGPSATIPLYLVLANHVGLEGDLPDDVRVSKTLVLQTLVQLFCQREVARLGVGAEEQMAALDEIAEWLTIEPLSTADDLLQALGVDADDTRARVVLSPHALLLLKGDGSVEFKFPELGALFAARALASNWKEVGLRSVITVLRSKRLDELVIEYLARFIHAAVISGAWVESSTDADRSLLLRRNLLAVALAKVYDSEVGATSNARSASLAGSLGNRLLTNVSLAGLTLERFDFGDWTIKGVRGHDGSFVYCENLHKSDFDESVASVQLEGCSFADPTKADRDLSNAIERLAKLVKPLRRKTGGTLVTMMSVEEARDPLTWAALQKAGAASRTGKARAAKWELTSTGTRLLTAFNTAYSGGTHVLRELIEADAEVRSLLEHLADSR